MTGTTFLPIKRFKRSGSLKIQTAEEIRRQRHATVDALIGIKPKDEIEGMIAAQLVACHNASMECYRRAMLPSRRSRAGRENLNQANKLSRTYATLARKPQSPPRQGPAEGHGRARPRPRGRASHRRQRREPGGWVRIEIKGTTPCKQLPMHQAPRCRARTRRGSPCQSPAMPNGRCRMHGGTSPGAPKGNKNALKHGRYTAEAIARRREIAELIRTARDLFDVA